MMALADLLGGAETSGLSPRKPHFAPKAKSVIFLFMEGGPSQMDLFDPKPLLNERDGEPLPESLAARTQFAFLQKDTARLMGTSRTFRRYGECGMEFSNLLPHIAQCADDITMIRSMHTDQFNHVPAQLLMNCGSALAGANTAYHCATSTPCTPSSARVGMSGSTLARRAPATPSARILPDFRCG